MTKLPFIDNRTEIDTRSRNRFHKAMRFAIALIGLIPLVTGFARTAEEPKLLARVAPLPTELSTKLVPAPLLDRPLIVRLKPLTSSVAVMPLPYRHRSKNSSRKSVLLEMVISVSRLK